MNKTAGLLTAFIIFSANASSVSANQGKGLELQQQTESKVQEDVKLGQKLNVNQADVSQLTQIVGIGPKKAQAIVEYINQNGKLTSLDEMVNIKGIGNKLVKRLSPYLTTH